MCWKGETDVKAITQEKNKINENSTFNKALKEMNSRNRTLTFFCQTPASLPNFAGPLPYLPPPSPAGMSDLRLPGEFSLQISSFPVGCWLLAAEIRPVSFTAAFILQAPGSQSAAQAGPSGAITELSFQKVAKRKSQYSVENQRDKLWE